MQTANATWAVQAAEGLEISDSALDMIVTGLRKADIAARELGLSEVKVGRIITVTAADLPDPMGKPLPDAETDFFNQRCYITVLPSA